MDKLGISVAMCTYNGEKYLKYQLESIIFQSYTPKELIICDDGSKDNTIAIINKFSQKAPFPIRLYQNNTNLGSTKNFEKAISLCNEEIIVLSDQDDIWAENKLERIMEEFSKSKETGAVFSDALLIDDQGRSLGQTLWDSVNFTSRERKKALNNKIIKVLLNHNVVTGAAMAFKSSYRDIILPIPKDWVHDAWIALLLGIFSKIVPISDPLIYYRIHSEQQIGAAINQTLRDEINAAKKVTNEIYLKVQNNYEEVQKLISSYPSLIKNKNSVVKAINGKISHYQDRIEIHEIDFKIKRLPLILLNTLNGRYFRYSSGLKSILKDLLLD
ncbi:MAG: hypothetical protein PWQ59_2015 [Thermoanaerobacterium sp.]|nr:hypothetical protein [Thermoanaerobacterium sp.]